MTFLLSDCLPRFLKLGLGSAVLVDALLQQGRFLKQERSKRCLHEREVDRDLKERVEVARAFHLEQLLGLLLLQDGDRVVRVDAEALQDPLALLSRLLRRLLHLRQLLVHDEHRALAIVSYRPLEGDRTAVGLRLVGVLPLVPQRHLDHRLLVTLLDEVGQLVVPLRVLAVG